MISGIKRVIGYITAEERGDQVVIDGLPGYEVGRDIASTWGTSRINSHMFSTFSKSKIIFPKFFAIDILYIFEQLVDTPNTRTPKRVLQKIMHELTLNTWLKDINFQERHNRVDFSKVNAVTFKLLPHQFEFLHRYNKVVPSYQLKGMLLAAPPGSGKTITDLVLGACLHADVMIIVSPKNAIERVWEATIRDNMTTRPKWWVSYNSGPAPLGMTHYVFHYEALDRAVELAKKLRGKKVFVALDESHNFNVIDSQRTLLFIQLCQITNSQDVLWASGTPIKAMGAECIPLLRTIDPFFTRDAEERFRKIFGRDAKRANDILCNRIGLISYKVEKKTVVDVKVIAQEVKIQMPNAEIYTLESIRDEMRKFIDERTAYYKSRLPELEREYYECLEIHAQTLKTPSQLQAFRLYGQYVAMIREKYDPVMMKQEVMYCNRYELKEILPTLPENRRKSFKSLRSVIKYLELKIMGEALGGVLGKRRTQCHVEMVEHIPFSRLIDEAKKKTLIFTSYVEVVVAVNEKLKREGYEPIVVYGDTNKDLRSMIERFDRDENVNPTIATFQSLSTAVPLIMANNIVNVNSPFREHERDQSISRCARLGQDEDVTVWDCFLDTGTKANISTRSKDILEWSRSQVEQIMGIDAPVDLDASLEDMLLTSVPLEVSQERFVRELRYAYHQMIWQHENKEKKK